MGSTNMREKINLVPYHIFFYLHHEEKTWRKHFYNQISKNRFTYFFKKEASLTYLKTIANFFLPTLKFTVFEDFSYKSQSFYVLIHLAPYFRHHK